MVSCLFVCLLVCLFIYWFVYWFVYLLFFRLDKNVYRPDETMTVHYTIRNTSSVDVQNLLIKVTD